MDIAAFTAETIIEDDVFQTIMDIKDEITREKLIQELIERATLLGIKTKFTKILAAYKRKEKEYIAEQKQKSRNGDKLENQTCFDLEDTEYKNMFCGPWMANEQGVKMTIYIGQFPVEKMACYHPILPVCRLENAETGKEKIKVAFRKGLYWKEIVVDKGVIASANRIVALADYGVSVTSENAKSLVGYLADLENWNVYSIKTQISTSKLGWIKDQFMPYGNDIMFDDESRFKSTYEAIAQVGDRDEWYKLAKQVRKSDRFEPKIYMIGALASVLVEKLNALPFVINLWGSTGKGKTVAIMFAASVWANPGGNEYVTDVKGTVTALELRLNFLNNLPMLIDDTSQLKEKYNDDFSELIYMLCSGKGKDRANANLGLNKSTSWRNIILTNGEHSLVTETMQGGAVNRIIDVEMADGYMFPNGNEVVEHIKQNYGWCGKDFIDLLTVIGLDEVKKLQQEFLNKINARAKELSVEKEEKQALPMSILLATDKIVTDYLFHDNEYMDFETCVNLLKNKGEVSEDERAYEYILSEVAANINKFDVSDEYNGEIWGVIVGDYVIIHGNKFNQICERGNFSRNAFLSWANKNKLIQTSMEKGKLRFTKKRKINGISDNCIHLKLPQDDTDFTQLSLNEAESIPFY